MTKGNSPSVIAFLLLTGCFLLLFSRPVRPADFYEKLSRYGSRELFDLGHKFGIEQQKTDSAFLCFSMIAGRYDKGMDEDGKRLCIDALTRMFGIYFARYYDYGKAYGCLYRAEAIQAELGSEIPALSLCYGNIYSAIAGPECDTAIVGKAVGNYRKAFWTAARQHDLQILHLAFDNLTLSAYSMSDLGSIEKEAARYVEEADSDVFFKYYLEQWRGLKALTAGRNAEALQCFSRQLDMAKDNIMFRRANTNAIENLYRTYCEMGDDRRAVAMLDTLETLSLRFDIKDALMNVCRLKADHYEKAGDTYRMMLYANRYFGIKDSLISYQRLMSIEEANFLGKLKEAEDRLNEVNARRRRTELAIAVASAIALIVAVFSLLLYVRNCQLRAKNMVLYRRQVESMAETERLCDSLRELQELKARPEMLPADGRKYKDSNLSDGEKDDIMQRIRMLLAGCDEIFSSDFSVVRLAELTGIRSRQLSQVINEKTGANFYVLINEFRIKEACRRMDDVEHYGRLTLEGISKSVGFKSRSSFTVFFKRFTGLSPSEYMHISKEKRSACLPQPASDDAEDARAES